MSNTDLSVRIINKTEGDLGFLIYQQPTNPTVKNFMTGAWAHQQLTNGGGSWDFTVPFSIQVSGRYGVQQGDASTNIANAHYKQVWHLEQKEESAFKIVLTGEQTTDDTIEIHNMVTQPKGPRWAVVNKNNKPLFAQEITPNEKVSFSIEPKLYIATYKNYKVSTFFKVVSLPSKPWMFEYQGAKSLEVTATQDPTTKEITLKGKLGAEFLTDFAPDDFELAA